MTELSRRKFLAMLTAAGAGALAPPLRWAAGMAAPTTQPDEAEFPEPDPNRPAPRTRLLSIVNPIAVKGNNVNEKYVAEMLAAGLNKFFGSKHPRDAWARLIKPADKVLVKFNRSGAEALTITDPMIQALLESLEAAGVKRSRVMLLDVTIRQQRRADTVPPPIGYQPKPVSVLGRPEHLHQALAWADRVINVPFVKDHHLAGVTCAMKNLSHGLIKTPARWHGERCREAIPHLFKLPQIKDKLCLTVCNALRMVVDGGPAVKQENIVNHQRLLFATDAVALDAYVARTVNQERGARGLKDLTEAGRPPDYLTVAHDLKLGQTDLDRLDILEWEA